MMTCTGMAWGQSPLARPIDVLHYDLGLDLSDFKRSLTGEAHIEFVALAQVDVFYLDFACEAHNLGNMRVLTVYLPGLENWIAHDDRLEIRMTSQITKGQVYELVIGYHGMPTDGLIVTENAFGQPTLFADNWPDRAHHWFPCADHPSDKATIRFKVTYPQQFSLIANGNRLVDTMLDGGLRYTEYATNTPLPTKVMVIGLANFAISEPCLVGKVEVTSWVYAGLRDQGFADYAPACHILDWYVDILAPYPYEKLANVQSTTRYGGMENASCIFYHENSVTGRGGVESLIAHEIAHQWFGNSATESDWPHLWLSEGFATYFTHMYLQEAHGHDTLLQRMRLDRDKVIRFHRVYEAPVIDTQQTELLRLLNPNSYEKGSWFLHMLRHRLGDSLFWVSMRTYYGRYQHANASTRDLLEVVNEVTGTDQGYFFGQWLGRAGHPVLNVSWKPRKTGGVLVTVRQVQTELFDFQLEMRTSPNGSLVKCHIHKRKTVVEISAKEPIQALEVDPYVNLLFEEASARP